MASVLRFRSSLTTEPRNRANFGIGTLAAAGKSSGAGIDGHASHFAIPREQCQQVDEAILPLAELGSDHLTLVSGDRTLGRGQGHDLAAGSAAWRCSLVRQAETSAARAIRCGAQISATAIRTMIRNPDMSDTAGVI
jgi:hypothetical protein